MLIILKSVTIDYESLFVWSVLVSKFYVPKIIVPALGYFHQSLSSLTLLVIIVCRILNVQLGERSRLAWLGVEADPLVQSDSLLKVYSRPSEDVNRPSSKWFISKNAIVSGLGLLGIKQGTVADGEPAAPKARRKRIVRKMVTTSWA